MRSELCHMVKGDRKISEHLLRIKAIVDSLIFISNPVSFQEYLDAILEGLPYEYQVIFPTIESRVEPYTITEIESLLAH